MRDEMRDDLQDITFGPPRKTRMRRLRVWLAWWCTRLVFGSAEDGVDYTSRCLGCGYYAGEEKAGDDHYGWDCGSTEIPWWEPIRVWFNNNWRR